MPRLESKVYFGNFQKYFDVWKPSSRIILHVPLRLAQRFSTRGLQECLKHAIPAYLVRGTDLFSLSLSNFKKMTTANTTIAVCCEWIQVILMLFQIGKNVFILVCHRIVGISLCAMRWKRLKITGLAGWESLLQWIILCQNDVHHK